MAKNMMTFLSPILIDLDSYHNISFDNAASFKNILIMTENVNVNI